jgi:hypothetical protein
MALLEIGCSLQGYSHIPFEAFFTYCTSLQKIGSPALRRDFCAMAFPFQMHQKSFTIQITPTLLSSAGRWSASAAELRGCLRFRKPILSVHYTLPVLTFAGPRRTFLEEWGLQGSGRDLAYTLATPNRQSLPTINSTFSTNKLFVHTNIFVLANRPKTKSTP